MNKKLAAYFMALAVVSAMGLASSAVLAKPAQTVRETVGAKACIPGRPGCLPVQHRPPPNVYLHFWFGNYPPPYYYSPYYYPYPYAYPPDWQAHHALPMSCKSAKNRLSKAGFKSLKTIDCDGRYYEFTGLRGGRKYRITMNALTGRYNWSVLRK